mmetsp:Transcript_3096/g.7746  ORF Transcript_3096/g.7746 Transcript_3096/m.7746 type:complete len:326 (+) Transcript_3096:376-1353(+)
MYWRQSNLPGRSRAASMRSGLFVAPTMKMLSFPSDWMPSSSARNWLTTRSMTPPESPPLPLAGASESSSSKNTMHGAALLALAKISLTFLSLSPTYMLISSGPFTLRKFMWNSVAMALAKSVLPVPGGPYSSTPDLRRRSLLKSQGYLSGVSIVDMIASLASSRPPTSLHCTDGTFGAPSVFAILSFVIRRAVFRHSLGTSDPLSVSAAGGDPSPSPSSSLTSDRAYDLEITALRSLAVSPTVSNVLSFRSPTPGSAFSSSRFISLEVSCFTSWEKTVLRFMGNSSMASVVATSMMLLRGRSAAAAIAAIAEDDPPSAAPLCWAF